MIDETDVHFVSGRAKNQYTRDGAQELNDQDQSDAESERSLILAVQNILAQSGQSFSEGAVRDLPGQVRDVFDPLAAVSAFKHLGFEASFGEMCPSTLVSGHCPAICFDKEGRAVLLKSISETGMAEIYEPLNGDLHTVAVSELPTHCSRFVVLVKMEAQTFSRKRNNDWFWGAFTQSKWLYAQVIVAAAITNF